MGEHPELRDASTAGPDALPVAPSLSPTLATFSAPRDLVLVDRRVVLLCAVSLVLALAAGLIAQGLTRLIGLITNLSFYGRWSFAFSSPAENHLGIWVVGVPVGGALIIGVMARYGSRAIRGHGIPEAMEQVLFNGSRIPARITYLKPISSAIAIGTGGPFGAEGPIIATGGALGSVIGQLMHINADERKTLLAAGAAAGMAATFGSPVSAVLLAVELLLFEYRPRSIIPVALATATATAVRLAFVGSAPIFAMPHLTQPSGGALASYIVIGALVGFASVWVTHAVYWVEDNFDKLPIHWMWWPALGAIAVGVVGYFAPRTMGVGYDNIDRILGGQVVGRTLAVFIGLKFLSWSISLGSGTSGGTLAPLFTIGGGLGALFGAGASLLAPGWQIDPRVAALVGMAAMFAGASRALLTSVVFAFETTQQSAGLLPLLGGCTAAYLVSCLQMRTTIMTEKIARRGVRVLAEYSVDFLDQILARDQASRPVRSLFSGDTLASARAFILGLGDDARHQGFPVVDGNDDLVGVVTRRDLLDPARTDEGRIGDLIRRPPAVCYEDSSLRDAADQMVREAVGRLPVVSRAQPRKVVGILTRSDLLAAHAHRLAAQEPERPTLGRSKSPTR